MKYSGEFEQPRVGLPGSNGGTQVIDLWRRKVTSRSRITSDVLEYWESLRDGPAMPQRMDVNPSLMGAALPYVFLLEKIGPGLTRLRLAGRHLHDLAGRDVRSSPITSFFAPEARADVLPVLDAVFDGPSSVSLDLVAKRAGKPSKAAEMLILPLSDRTGQVTRALGCIVARGPIEFTPYRFMIDDMRLTPMAKPVIPVPVKPQKRTLKTEQTDIDWKSTSVPWLKIVQ